MKFSTAFQVSREKEKEKEGEKRSRGRYLKIPSLTDRQPKASPENGTNEGAEHTQKTPKAKALRDIWQKAGASIRSRGAKLERSMTQKRTGKKVVKSQSKRNSRIQPSKLDIDDDVLDRIMASPKEKKASNAFLEKQRVRASRQHDSTRDLPEALPASTNHRLSLDDQVQDMFVGAPRFRIKEHGGRRKPHVVFGGDDARSSVTFPSDHGKFGHTSFAACTLSQEDSGESEAFDTSDGERAISEVPSMLSEQGLDNGAVGLEYFLQLPISDAFVKTDGDDILAKRKMLYSEPEKLGLRELSLQHLIVRLSKLSELHATWTTTIERSDVETWGEDKIAEEGKELFAKLLNADEDRSTTDTKCGDLQGQTKALEKVLEQDSLWYDFSLVECRVRIGQLLWASDGLDTDHQEQPSERDVLLLQITLAAELLVRRNTFQHHTSDAPRISAEQRNLLASRRKPILDWNILLAERFLSHLSISTKVVAESEKTVKRNSLLSAITYFTAKEGSGDTDKLLWPILSPKNEAKQIDGLIHFAEALQWPHTEEISGGLAAKRDREDTEKPGRPVSMVASVYATPLTSPSFPTTPGARTSFFGFSSQQRKPGLSRTTTAQSIQLLSTRRTGTGPAAFECGGWLSRSWFSGLVMPGEPASHFLISALLENSPQAITALGEQANLYGGFLYEGRSYWSKHCVVGRVLGAAKDAKECMGWVSAPLDSDEHEDGWLNLDVKEMPDVATLQPRIKSPEAIATDSDPFNGQDIPSTSADSFTRPADCPRLPGNELSYHGLTFKTSQSSLESDAASTSEDLTSSSVASMTFSSPTNSEIGRVEVPLTYDAYFVSSYPCHPKTLQRRSKSFQQLQLESVNEQSERSEEGAEVVQEAPATAEKTDSPTTVAEDKAILTHSARKSRSRLSTTDKELPPPPTHPLHIDHHFDVVPAATLLGLPTESRPRVLASPTDKPSEATPADKNVIVLDCRGSEGLELFARAWCAKVGENAIIGKTARTCLACCVREARALGICVVIRI